MSIWLLCIAGAYVVGAIPFGYLIGRAKGVDIRQLGSRNIGATNVGRVLGKPLGILCFALDALKGAGPVLVAGSMMGTLGSELVPRSSASPGIEPVEMWMWLAVAGAAVAGHMWSIFLGFRGGKGVATGFGAMVSMWPVLTLPALFALLTWLVVLRLTRYMSLASMIGVASLPIWLVLSNTPADAASQPFAATIAQLGRAGPAIIATTALALLVVFRHRSNIVRLIRGQEPKVTERARRGDLLGEAEPPAS